MGGWLVYIAIISVLTGWAVSNFDDLFTGNDTVAEWLAGSRSETAADAFLAILSYILCLLVACVAIGIAVRTRTEEARGFVSPLLAASASRTRWMAGHLVMALAAPIILLIEVGLFTSLAYGIASGRMGVLADQLQIALLFVPAVWVVAAIPFAVFGLRPRMVLATSWLTMGMFVLIISLWEMDQISETTLVFTTPFGNSHPAVAPSPAAAVASAIVAALLVAVGVLAFRGRDISEDS